VVAPLHPHPGISLDVTDVVGLAAVRGDQPEDGVAAAHPDPHRGVAGEPRAPAGRLQQGEPRRAEAVPERGPGQPVVHLLQRGHHAIFPGTHQKFPSATWNTVRPISRQARTTWLRSSKTPVTAQRWRISRSKISTFTIESLRTSP